MSEVERRRSYWYNAILIDSDRVLTPQFDDAVIYVTGAQLELLRNVTQYLNRRNTYKAETHDGYYLVPDDADYDDILEIVADLEEKLMGNPNTIWGYEDRFTNRESDDNPAGPNLTLTLATCPAGKVYVINHAAMWNINSLSGRQQFNVTGDGDGMVLEIQYAVIAARFTFWQGHVILKEGDTLIALFKSITAGDDCYAQAWGYIMDVPE